MLNSEECLGIKYANILREFKSEHMKGISKYGVNKWAQER